MLESLIILTVFLCLIFTGFFRPKNYPNGPLVFPLVGIYPMVDQSHPMDTWSNMHKKYGGLVGFCGGPYTAVLVSGWEAVTETMMNDDCQGRPDVCLIRDRFDGDNYGVVFTEGDHWRVQRRFTLHHFRNLGFGRKSHESFIEEESMALIKEVAECKDEPFSLVEKVAISVINTTWSLMGGTRYEHKDPQMQKLARHIEESLHNVQVTGSVAVLIPFVRYLFPEKTGYNSVKRGSKGVQEFAKAVIAEHKRTFDPEAKPRDLIDAYLGELMNNNNNKELDKSFTETQLEALLMDLLSAGTDTTSATVTFAVMHLATHPEKQEKMQREMDNILGAGIMPTVADKSRLPYCNAVINEILRLRGPLPIMIPHKVTKTTKVQDKVIPEGTFLLINVYSVHMDEEYWKNPKEFRPERFIDEEGKLRKEERLIAFGKGKRACLGETLGKIMTFMFLTSLIQSHKFTWAFGEAPSNLRGSYGFTLAPPQAKLVATARS